MTEINHDKLEKLLRPNLKNPGKGDELARFMYNVCYAYLDLKSKYDELNNQQPGGEVTNNNTQELLPCPFCCGEAKLEYQRGDAGNTWAVICTGKKECPLYCHRPYTVCTKEQAIAFWNTRHTTHQPESKELLEWINEFSKGVTNLNLLELLDHCKAFIENVQKGSEWLPIETAPKDGTAFLAFAETCPEYGVQVIYWGVPNYEDKKQWMSDGCSLKSSNILTHWQPLPAIPNSKKQSNQQELT